MHFAVMCDRSAATRKTCDARCQFEVSLEGAVQAQLTVHPILYQRWRAPKLWCFNSRSRAKGAGRRWWLPRACRAQSAEGRGPVVDGWSSDGSL